MAFGDVLTPLRERYASWLTLTEEDVREAREEPADQVRALQLILRLERQSPEHPERLGPSLHRALAFAASLSARICLDPRADAGGEWHEAVADYCRGHIRKVTRRGRGAQWAAVVEAEDLPGLTAADGVTQVHALLPGLISELDKRVAKLQVGGTDLPVDVPVDVPAGALHVWVPTDPPMTAGKQMAQTGHAGMMAAALLAAEDPGALRRWYDAGCPVHVERRAPVDWVPLLAGVSDPRASWQDGLVAVRDAGFTEIAPGTVTAIASVTPLR